MSATPRQHELLAYILRFREERGVSPSVREMCAALGVRSTNAVACLLRALERKGLVRSAGRVTGGLFGSGSGRCTLLTPGGEAEARRSP